VGNVHTLGEGNRTAPTGLIDLRGISKMDIEFATLNTITSEVDSHHHQSKVKAGLITGSPMQCTYAGTIQMFFYAQPVEIQTIEHKKDALD
jgi:hypothetical protein